jgi:hypothetical protein
VRVEMLLCLLADSSDSCCPIESTMSIEPCMTTVEESVPAALAPPWLNADVFSFEARLNSRLRKEVNLCDDDMKS